MARKKTIKLFVIRKVVRARTAKEALEKEKSEPALEVIPALLNCDAGKQLTPAIRFQPPLSIDTEDYE